MSDIDKPAPKMDWKVVTIIVLAFLAVTSASALRDLRGKYDQEVILRRMFAEDLNVARLDLRDERRRLQDCRDHDHERFQSDMESVQREMRAGDRLDECHRQLHLCRFPASTNSR